MVAVAFTFSSLAPGALFGGFAVVTRTFVGAAVAVVVLVALMAGGSMVIFVARIAFFVLE